MDNDSRPSLGPLLYVSPGGGYTTWHRDGFGTVDSGHANLHGYNEVVMMRRLPMDQAESMCDILGCRDAMFMMPNEQCIENDKLKECSKVWPTKRDIGTCQRLK